MLQSSAKRSIPWLLMLFYCLLFLSEALGQSVEAPSGKIDFSINESVKNEAEDYFQEIYANWQDYLNSGQYVRRESAYWDYAEMPFPDYSYIQLLLDLRSIVKSGDSIQCNLLGLIPVAKDHYVLKCMFTQQDSTTGQIQLKYIVRVYAKLVAGKYVFVNSTEYHKKIWRQEVVGTVNYCIHPEHLFDRQEALKMNEFNRLMAKKFEVEPIAFEYIVANNTTQLNSMLGYDHNSYSYRPVQSGGMADNFNKIIYAGNNSAYYPHEVVHLYTNKRFSGQYFSWVDEGIAAFFGGSTGYYLEWHLQKLKTFLKENPDYDLSDLSALNKDVPNGEYTTDFRYAIGGLIIKKIYEQEGMPGLFEALQAGKREEDYFAMIEQKLQVPKSAFGDYIKAELGQLEVIEAEEMAKLKY